jgi:hypothetical protein
MQRQYFLLGKEICRCYLGEFHASVIIDTSCAVVLTTGASHGVSLTPTFTPLRLQHNDTNSEITLFASSVWQMPGEAIHVGVSINASWQLCLQLQLVCR